MLRLGCTVAASCLLASAQAFYPRPPLTASELRTRNSAIAWGPCVTGYEEIKSYDTPIDCANLTVPLDYGDESKGTIELRLLRAHAPKGPSRGSVLLNYGGPGGEGRTTLVSSLPWAFTVTGFVHDLVIFDPRGTANTIPMKCYNSTETPGTTIVNSNASDVANGEIWVGAQNLADACLQRNGTIGPYMGTAAVARDLMSVVDALREDGLLRYFGISYGSVLGATVAAMFPERIDKMFLDGISNAHEYYHSLDLEWLTSSDKVWSDFFDGCVKAPSACAIARDGKTAQQLEDEFYQWLYGLKHEPMSLGTTSVMTYSTVKQFVFDYIYEPVAWKNISKVLDASYQRNTTLINELFADLPQSPSGSIPLQSLYGIKCSDKIPRTTSYEEWLPQAFMLEGVSKIMADVIVGEAAICANWKMPAVEIYQGDFQVNTRTPIVFASNEFDVVTPLVSARNMSSGFEGSVVLVNKGGHGHATLQQPSACILQHVVKYFVDGIVPPPDTNCETSAPLFGNVTQDDVIAMVNGRST